MIRERFDDGSTGGTPCTLVDIESIESDSAESVQY